MKTLDDQLKRLTCDYIVKAQADLILAIDVNYDIILVNDAMMKNSSTVFGVVVEEGRNLNEIAKNRTSFLEPWNNTLKSGCKSNQTFLIEDVTCIVSCSPISNNMGIIQAVYGIIKIEYKSEKITQEQLPQTQVINNFETVADYIPHMVWTARPDGHCDFYNQRWFDYTGLNAEESFGNGWERIIHPDDIVEVSRKWPEAVEHALSYHIRYRLRKADNTYRWHLGKAEPILDANGKVVKWIGTCTDIENFMQTESKLSTVTQQLNLLLTAAHVGVWTVDFQTKRTNLDRNTMSLFNITHGNGEHTLGEILALVHPEDRLRVEAQMQKAIQERTLYDSEFRLAGTEKYLAGRGNIVVSPTGEPLKMIGINWDVTARNLLAQERLKALQFAEEQSRQRIQEAQEHHKRLEEFVDTICHEIRNPLNGISGMLSLMQSLIQPFVEEEGEMEEPTDVKNLMNQLLENINIMEQCAEQQRIIVDDVLDLSKVENDKLELTPTIFNPKNLLQNLRNIFAASIQQKHLECEVFISQEADCTFKADAHRLSQIIMNLLSNSIKFTEHGKVSVRISKQVLEGENRILNFSVADTGIGMTSEELSKLFNKFSQANSSIGIRYGGSGLGLMISKKLVELMGGNFHVKSQKGIGTQFDFSIRCKEVSKEEYQPPQQSASTNTNINLASKRILIVEDSIINQKILTSYLQQQKCLCQVVNNGVEALSVSDQCRFDVIFMDLEMPLMGGLEATQKLRSKSSLNQFTPIIGLSGNARKEHIDEAIKCGMNAYLTKPYHKTDIFKAVSQMCELYRNNESDGRALKRKKSQ